ncbi:MAG TPA: hypothetical protein VJ779_11125 [Acetobacteraceae bacterium]|nr:hypothetical protein [Acetobacteraceae bacterium]
MRLALLGLAVASLFSAEIAVAEPCASSVDQGAFDTAALKSELMVVALTCDRRDDYNAFVQRFRPDLAREERALNSWFSRAYGRRAQQMHDGYITNLANAESQQGIRRGSLFCQERAALFPTVLRLRGAEQLVNFAAHRPQPQPITLVSCTRTRLAGSPVQRPMRTAQQER